MQFNRFSDIAGFVGNCSLALHIAGASVFDEQRVLAADIDFVAIGGAGNAIFRAPQRGIAVSHTNRFRIGFVFRSSEFKMQRFLAIALAQRVGCERIRSLPLGTCQRGKALGDTHFGIIAALDAECDRLTCRNPFATIHGDLRQLGTGYVFVQGDVLELRDDRIPLREIQGVPARADGCGVYGQLFRRNIGTGQGFHFVEACRCMGQEAGRIDCVAVKAFSIDGQRLIAPDGTHICWILFCDIGEADVLLRLTGIENPDADRNQAGSIAGLRIVYHARRFQVIAIVLQIDPIACERAVRCEPKRIDAVALGEACTGIGFSGVIDAGISRRVTAKVEAGEFDDKVAAAVRLYQFGAGDIGGNHPVQLGSVKVDGVKFLTVIVEDQCAGIGADGHTAGDGIDAVFGGDAQRIGHQSAAFHSQLAHIGQVAAADEEGMGRITAVGEVIGRAGNCLLIGVAESFMAALTGVILPRSVQDKLSGAALGHHIGRGAGIPFWCAELIMGEAEIQVRAARQAGDRHSALECIGAPSALRFRERAAGNRANRGAFDAAFTQFKGDLIGVHTVEIHGAAEADRGRFGGDLQGKFDLA